MIKYFFTILISLLFFNQTLAKDVIFPKRLGSPEEFAQYAVQIVENQYINGSVLRLDGGIRLA